MMRGLRHLWLICALVLTASGSVRADEITVDAPRLEANDYGYALSADFDFELPARLEDAIANGIPLYFVIEFQIERPRWYWFDEQVAQPALRQRLTYHALTKQYRLSSGALHQSFGSLDEALRAIARLRAWHVLDRNQLRANQTYDCYLRIRLDLTQLPRPFQISAITNREWTLASAWKHWRFTAPAEIGR